MDVFGPKDMLRLIGHAEGSSPPPDARQQSFLKDIEAFQAKQNGQPLPAGVASGGPAMAAPGAMPQLPPGVAANPLQAALAQRQMQEQQAQAPQMGGVMGMQLLPLR